MLLLSQPLMRPAIRPNLLRVLCCFIRRAGGAGSP